MRIHSLALLGLVAIMTSSRPSYGRNDRSFVEPHSILLFGGPLLLVTPTGNTAVPTPPGWIGQYASPLPALSPSGDQVAWSLKFGDGFGYGGCDPTVRPCAKKFPEYKFVLGVYDLHGKAWKFYGDFCSVGSAVFSPNGRQIAFMGRVRSGNPSCNYVYNSDLLQILVYRL